MANRTIDTIEEIVDWIIEQSQHTVEQGDRFERLMLAFFKNAPVWQEQFDEVWLWKEWAGNRAETDHGIDLVAKNRGEDTFTAIQAKCYSRTTTLNKPEVDSFISASGGDEFTRRILVATTYNIGSKAQKEMDRQTKPVQLVSLSDLRDAGIDWADWSPDTYVVKRSAPKEPKDHQQRAIDAVLEGFEESDRGKAIMACGTGKTYTAQLIAERVAGAGGLVLVMAPSISLVSQTLTAWSADATLPLTVFGVCSDTTAGDRDSGDISPYDMVVPATTDPATLAANVAAAPTNGLRVVFSTYHSAAVVGEAQKIGGFGDFDLIICDEAHRTTGVQLASQDTKAFQLVHEDENIAAAKRLYMTATPRVYKPSQRTKAAENEAFLSSMDDENVYGPEFFKLSFREAVDLEELTDYKVIILTVEEDAVNEAFQRHTADLGEVNLPEAAQMVGCLNALAKRERLGDDEDVRAFRAGDTVPLQRAVAFSNTIKASKHFASEFERIAAEYQYITHVGKPLTIETDHVDGSQRTVERTRKLDWLRDQPGESISRILSNAKCLTEGIDVPSLDAVLFLEPRKSQVDIIQAVGRVMRTSPGKDFGYIVIPIAVPPGTSPEAVLKDGRFKTVWQVLSALRSHDPDMNRDINQIRFGKKPKNVDIINASPDLEVDDPSPPDTESASDETNETALTDQLQLEFDVEQFQELCWATMVQKVGDTAYLKRWAKNVADIAAALEERISNLASTARVKEPFRRFVEGLRSNLNGQISTDDAVAMLAQHIITRPVFDSIFPNYSLLASNPIARAMQDMLEVLEDTEVETETRELDAFYDSVRYHVDGLEDPHARQSILIELYEEFFKTAFPKRASSLGIVYTPIEVTDFILALTESALSSHFKGASLSDTGVHVLDPFTGTGTFIVQLLRSGYIKPADLARKFASELHANEIQLLAYYIATVNIETAFHSLAGEGEEVDSFEGIVYTDTFQLDEGGSRLDLGVFPSNSQRAESQRALDIRAIVGNPPYSGAQESENDNNANLSYPTLDGRISATYTAASSSGNTGALSDSYVRAIRWASDRVLNHPDGGVVSFVTNGGYIESNSFDGFRRSLESEFDFVYVLNLRGNQKLDWRREGGKIFGEGSTTTVAVVLLVRTAESSGELAEIRYADIGEYLDREEKLARLSAFASSESALDAIDWLPIKPNESADWINQRSMAFQTHLAVDAKSGPTLFSLRTQGLQTNRDAWNYNSSRAELVRNGQRMVQFFNGELEAFHGSNPELTGKKSDKVKIARSQVDTDPSKFKWNDVDFGRLVANQRYEYEDSFVRETLYRPFHPRFGNRDPLLNKRVFQLEQVFPYDGRPNQAIAFTPPGAMAPPFSVLMTAGVSDNGLFASSSTGLLPRWIYAKADDALSLLPTDAPISAIAEDALGRFHALDETITGDDVFHYVYGLLHSPTYRSEFADDLRKELPHIPIPLTAADFFRTRDIGSKLAEIHVNYALASPYPGVVVEPSTAKDLRVEKMRYPKTRNASGESETDRTKIIYNDDVTISGIPLRAHDWRLGSKSAVDWVVDQWRYRTHESGIDNDPNAWPEFEADPAFLVTLLQRVVAVSMETLDLIDSLPEPAI